MDSVAAGCAVVLAARLPLAREIGGKASRLARRRRRAGPLRLTAARPEVSDYVRALVVWWVYRRSFLRDEEADSCKQY